MSLHAFPLLIFAALLIILSTAPTNAEPLFPYPFSCTAGYSSDCLAADFDEDGSPDVVASDYTLGLLYLFVNRGDATFAFGGSFPYDVPFAHVTAIRDFDADGHQDVLLASRGVSSNMAVMLGDGTGSFTMQPAVTGLGKIARQYVVGDLDEDGWEDIAALAYIEDDTVSGMVILLNRGDGTFSVLEVPIGPHFGKLRIGDFNGDDHLDLLGIFTPPGPFTQHAKAFFGRGDGTFDMTSPSFVVSENSIGVAVGELNGDSFMDFAVFMQWVSDVVVYYGMPDGSFLSQTAIGPGAVLQGSGPDLDIGDLDGDGLGDLVVNDMRTEVFMNRGGGVFEHRETIQFRTHLDYHFVDFNGDGRLDLQILNLLLLGNGDGTFVHGVHFTAGRNPTSAAVGDFDADGLTDLAVTNFLRETFPGGSRVSGSLQVFLGKGDGRVDLSYALRLDDHLASVAVGDFDRDSIPDLVTTHRVPNEFSIHLGLGDGTFSAPDRFATGSDPSKVLVADFDGDRIDDLAVRNNSSVSILRGYGDGTFTGPKNWTIGRGHASMVTDDFNGDGILDLAVPNAESNDVSVLLGAVDGRFPTQILFNVGEDPASIASGDVNGDGLTDLIVANKISEDLSILFGSSTDLFAQEVRLLPDVPPRDAVVEDFDADGRLDLLISDFTAQILRGRGDGTFTSGERFRAGFPGQAVGDFNTDGLPDLAFTFTGGSSFVLLNQVPLANARPVAIAGVDQVKACTSAVGARVIVNGSNSRDHDSSPGTNDDIVLFEWFEDFGQPSETFLGLGDILSVTLSLGDHRITLRVTDTEGQTDTDEVLITVVDPSLGISVSLVPPVLWPPNHRMVEIEALVRGGICRPLAAVLESVTSSEPDDAVGSGDGRTTDDIQGTDAGSFDTRFLLRAERIGKGIGRTYSVTYRSEDGSDDGSTATAFAFVPHDVDGVTEPVMITTFENGAGTVNAWTEVPGALYYNVVRGQLSNLREFETTFHVGQLTCIASAITMTNTLGAEDPELPPLGEAFFYLVEYNNGLSSGYGTESAAKERFAPPGQGNCP